MKRKEMCAAITMDQTKERTKKKEIKNEKQQENENHRDTKKRSEKKNKIKWESIEKGLTTTKKSREKSTNEKMRQAKRNYRTDKITLRFLLFSASSFSFYFIAFSKNVQFSQSSILPPIATVFSFMSIASGRIFVIVSRSWIVNAHFH